MKRALSFLLLLVMVFLTPVQALAVTPDATAKSLICLDREYDFLSGAEYTAISGSNKHAALLRPDNSLWMFGSNYEGQLGIGDQRHAYNAPIKVLEDVARVKTSDAATTAIKTDGSVWAFGEYIGSTPTKLLDNVVDADAIPTRVAYIDNSGAAYLKVISSGETIKLADSAQEIWLFHNSQRGEGLARISSDPPSSIDTRPLKEVLNGNYPSFYVLVKHKDQSVVQYGVSSSGKVTAEPVASHVEKITVYRNSIQCYVSLILGDGTLLCGDLLNGSRIVSQPDCVDVLNSPVGLYVLRTDGSLWHLNRNECLGTNVKLFCLEEDLAAFMVHGDNSISVDGINENYAPRLHAVNRLILPVTTPPMFEDIYAKTMEIVGDETDKYLQAKLVSEWITSNVAYQRGSHDQSGVEAFRQGTAVCAGFASLTSIMLGYLDIPVATVSTVRYSGYSNHAWNVALIDGVTVFIDNTGASSGSRELGELFDYPFIESITPDGSTYTSEPCDAWAFSEVRGAYDYDLIDVDLGRDYRKAITREDFCSLVRAVIEQAKGQDVETLLTALGKESVPVTFTDTDNPDVAAMFRLGVINGTSPTTFAPTRNITRQEAAKIMRSLALALGQDVTAPAPTFADNSAIDAWAMEGVSFVAHNGIMNGRPTGFDPKNTISIQESILICYRYFDSVTG